MATPENTAAKVAQQLTSSKRSQTLVRGLRILDAIAEKPGSIAHIAEATGLTYSTVHRIASVLVEEGYLKSAPGREFELGPHLIALGFTAHARLDLVRIADDHLKKLSRETGDTVHLARRDGWQVTYLDKLPGSRPVEISSRIGGRKPIVTTGVGKALVLDAPDQELRALYDHDGALLPAGMGLEDWLAQMATYRSAGYCYDLGEDEPTIRCVAVPLRDATGKIIAAISVTSAVEYMPPERMRKLSEDVLSAAQAISHELGAPRSG